jgi:uncharacterized membrane protein YkvA (DUF1232 family)
MGAGGNVVWEILIGVVAGVAAMWLALIVALWLVRGRYDRAALRGALRLLPDLLRLLRRLATDATLPRGVRARLWALLAYLVSPIDLVPDFVPVIGYADDAIVVALALRSVVRRSGPEAIRRHWPGTADGLAAILRLAGEAPDARSGPPVPDQPVGQTGEVRRDHVGPGQ